MATNLGNPHSSQPSMSPAPRLDRHDDATDAQGHPRYRAMSRSAVVSVALGAASILTFFSGWLSIIPLVGIAVGIWALRRIADYPSELTGQRLAWTGIGLSAVLWVVGFGGLTLWEIRAVPFGYELVTFDQLQPDPDHRGEVLPPDVYRWSDEGQKLFIKGFMYPGRQFSGIQEFILVPSLSHCSYCAKKVKSTEMILVRMQGNKTVEFRRDQVGVGGRLKIDEQAARLVLGGFPYVLECDYFQ